MDREGGVGKVLRRLQIGTGPRRSPSARSETSRKKNDPIGCPPRRLSAPPPLPLPVGDRSVRGPPRLFALRHAPTTLTKIKRNSDDSLEIAVDAGVQWCGRLNDGHVKGQRTTAVGASKHDEWRRGWRACHNYIYSCGVEDGKPATCTWSYTCLYTCLTACLCTCLRKYL